MSKRPPRKKRKVIDSKDNAQGNNEEITITNTEQSSGQSSAKLNKTELDAVVSAVIPAVTKGVVETLQSMGLIKATHGDVPNVDAVQGSSAENNSSEQQNPPSVSLGMRVNETPLNDNLSSIYGTQGGMIQSCDLTRSLSLGVDPKLKGKIWSNSYLEFSSLLY